MRYKATRSLHYVDVEGVDRYVNEGDFLVKLSDGKRDALMADGLATAVKPDKKED
jgi:hypothetical protein